MDALVRSLDGTGASVAEVGGKAASLDRLVALGFPVPASLALTARAYRSFTSGPAIRSLIEQLRSADPPAGDAIEAEIVRIDHVFADARMPDELEGQIRQLAARLLARGRLAVRSSATAEDLASASFAGQYRTFLDLETVDQVLEAVRRCWASLWGPSVRAYRRHSRIDDEDVAMGVILQVMVPAEWAGVMFTRDPEGGSSTARIEAVRGLGEALVSGAVTPHDYRVDRSTFAVRGSHRHWPPPFLEDLLRLGLRLERRMGAPQDVEWAFATGELVVLQSRPITSLAARRADDDGFDTRPIPGATYTPVGVQEMLPGVLPPLLWTINARMLDEAFRRLFHDLGIRLPDEGRPYLAIGRFRGRAALNLSVLRDASASMPGGSRAEVERQYLGRVVSVGDEPPAAGGRLRRALAGLRALRVRRRVEDEVALFVEAAHGVVALGPPLGELPVSRLVAYRARVRDLAHRGYAAEVSAAAGAAAAYRALEMTLARWTGEEEAARWAQRITTGPQPFDQAGVNAAAVLWKLYGGAVREHDLCGAALAGATPAEIEERLRATGEDGRRLIEVVDRVARQFGSMAVYGGPSWDEQRAVVWERLRDLVRCEGTEHDASLDGRLRSGSAARESAVDALLSELRSSWKWKLTRVLTGQIVDARGRLLRKLTADASRFLALRERAKAALLVLGGEERRLIVQAGVRLRASGLLEDPGDVLFLSDLELEEMLLGAEPVSAEELARRRIALMRAEEADLLPETFEGVPGVQVLPPIHGRVLSGWAASPGRVQARARLLRSLADARDLEPGTIIVARSTDPSWTPLFLVAGGLVLEQGGPLSHAAIVARELGIPAVLNVKGATKMIDDGAEIEVDGDAGTVTLPTGELGREAA